jgi:hypothetical protein
VNNAIQQQKRLHDKMTLMENIRNQQIMVNNMYGGLLGLVFQWQDLQVQWIKAATTGDIRAIAAIEARLRAVDLAYTLAQKSLFEAELALLRMQAQLRNLP